MSRLDEIAQKKERSSRILWATVILAILLVGAFIIGLILVYG